jgi:hypothetical protein
METPEITALADWARTSTPADAVFLFPIDVRRSGVAGIFRARALRAVFVDWKGGGQVNYLPVLAEEWWRRWQLLTKHPPSDVALPLYRTWGVSYVVTRAADAISAAEPVYRNRAYRVYAAR